MKYEVWGQTHDQHLSFGVDRGLCLEEAMTIVRNLKSENPHNDYWYEETTDDV